MTCMNEILKSRYNNLLSCKDILGVVLQIQVQRQTVLTLSTDYLREQIFLETGCLQYLRLTLAKWFSTIGMPCAKLK